MRPLFGLRPAMPDRGAGVRPLRCRTAHCPGQTSGVASADARRGVGVSSDSVGRPNASRSGKAQLHILDHPLAAAAVSILRAKTTMPDLFRRHLQEISVLLFLEAARTWETKTIRVETPLAPCA